LDRPIREGRAGDIAEQGALAEVAFAKAPVVPGKVHRSAADLPSILDGLHHFRWRLIILSKGYGLHFRIVG
jgi:hypothetical protein